MQINCKELRELRKQEIITKVKELPSKPKVVDIWVGDDIASEKYVNNKRKFVEECGMEFEILHFSNQIQELELAEVISQLNEDKSVNGIIVQLPLPSHINENIVQLVDFDKDIDGFIPCSLFTTCTPLGVIDILKHNNCVIDSSKVLVIGRGKTAGEPIRNLLIDNNATVLTMHSKTKESLEDIIMAFEPEIIVTATGNTRIINGVTLNKLYDVGVKMPHTIIDIGISRSEKGISGDIKKEYYPLLDKMGISYTTTPGGVGLMTVVNVAKNTLTAYKLQDLYKSLEE